MINVFLITQNEPFYIPKMVRLLLEKQQNNYKIIGATVLSPTRKNKKFSDWLNERLKIYTYIELVIVGLTFIYAKVINLLFKKKSPYSTKNILRKHGVKLINTNDINSSDFISKLIELDLDVIISISCPQIFDAELLKVPKLYCLNAHGTLLPRHRGVFGSFWTLHDNDKFAGSTIHTMEIRLDAGQILWQREFEVTKSDTQFSIAYKTKKDMALGLVDLLSKINRGDSIKIIEPNYKTSYHKAPTKEHAKEFRKLGRKIVKVKDILLMLKRSF